MLSPISFWKEIIIKHKGPNSCLRLMGVQKLGPIHYLFALSEGDKL